MAQSEKRELTAAEVASKTDIENKLAPMLTESGYAVNATVDENGVIKQYGRYRFPASEENTKLMNRIEKATESLKNSGHYLSTDLGDGFRSSILKIEDGILLFSIWESSFIKVDPAKSLREQLAALRPRQVTKKAVETEQAPF